MTQPSQGSWVSRHGGWLAGLLVGIAFLAWGAINCVVGMKPPERNSVSIAAVDAGQPLPGRWLEITGQLLREDRIIWPGPDTRETYVPLVSAEWMPLQPVAVFVRARENDWGQPGKLLHHKEPGVVGMVDRSGMDPDLAARFTEFGMPPRGDVIILDYESEPSSQSLILGFIGLGLGGLALFITTLAWLLHGMKRLGSKVAEAAHE